MKEINGNKLDDLLGGLTSICETPASQPESSVPCQDKAQALPAKGQKENTNSKERFERICTIVSPETMSKVRTLSSLEGVSIREIIGYGLEMVLARYEELHGKIRVKKQRKGDMESILSK